MANTHFDMGELLGCGGMGQVHAARDRTGRRLAVKRVHAALASDPLFADRLVEEARMLGNVCHPNVVRAFGLRERDGVPVLVMDRVAGEPLGDLITGEPPLPLSRIIVIAAQLLAGVGAIHDAGVIHADLKSNNILVDEVDVVTIIDFGLARLATGTDYTTGMIAGTPAYMAPEVIDGGAPTVASDIYAAATIVYEMLTGTTPYSGGLATILTHQLTGALEPPSQRAPHRGITADVDRVLVRALARTPRDRYQDVRDLARDLAAALATMPSSDEPAFDDQRTVMRLAPSSRSRDCAIADALETAHRHIEHRDLAAAAAVLDHAIATLADPDDDACPTLWRLEVLLAMVRVARGETEAACRIARCAYRRAVRSRCPIAELQTRELLARLAPPPRRLARGSRPMPALRRAGY